MSSYNPDTLTLTLGGSAYSESHEWSHVLQHYDQTLCWRLHAILRPFPYLGYFARVAVEVEATVLALWMLWKCGILQKEDLWEAMVGLGSYLWRLATALAIWLLWKCGIF